jgi:hypothetical protein
MNAVAKKIIDSQAPIRRLRENVAVAPLLTQLEEHPELWNQNRFRTWGADYTLKPHQQIDDIIVRFNHWKNWKGDRAKFNERHESVWWKPYETLTAVKPLVFDLARLFFAESIGMVLITRQPPQSSIKRHVDIGWHAQQYVKFAVQLKAAPGQKFCFDDLELETKPGDLYVFNNALPHWVDNPTDHERITLIMCLRLEQPICRNCTWQPPESK